MISLYGDDKYEFGNLFFDPNYEDHLYDEAKVDMICLDCSYEEEASACVLSEFADIN